MNSQKLWRYTRCIQVQTRHNPSIEKRGRGDTKSPIPKQEALCNLSFWFFFKAAKVYASFLGVPRPISSSPNIFSETHTVCYPVLYLGGREAQSSWKDKGKLSAGIGTLTSPPSSSPSPVYPWRPEESIGIPRVGYPRVWTAWCGCWELEFSEQNAFLTTEPCLELLGFLYGQ